MVEKSFNNPERSNKPLLSRSIRKNFHLSEFKIFGKSVFTIHKGFTPFNLHVVYFHGGAYLLQANSNHWKIIETIASDTACKLSYIDYPLAPEYNYSTTFEMVQLSVKQLAKIYPDDKFIFVGDSAGGGLALALAQKLKAENVPVQAKKIVLFSPWLDLSMKNPEIEKQLCLDILLPFDALISAGKKYSGGDDVENYCLSPINGDFKGLPETLVFCGTHELFYPDCMKLKELTLGMGNFSFHEFQDMQHDWVIFPIPEAKEALKLAIQFIHS